MSFVDDILLFAQAITTACTRLKNIIHEYCEISGQKVNFQKSIFQTTKGVENRSIRALSEMLGIPHTTSIEKYLGYPLINARVTKTMLTSLNEATELQLSKWKANANYIMQNFMLSEYNLRELDKANRNFFWNKG